MSHAEVRVEAAPDSDMSAGILSHASFPQAARTAIHDLPFELLSHIFMLGSIESQDETDSYLNGLYFWDGYTFHPLRDEDHHEAAGAVVRHISISCNGSLPLSFRANVSRVCTHWRKVAISTPSLWTTVIASPNESSFQYVQMQLARSGDLPIDIHVDDGRIREPSAADLKALYSLIIPHVHRWRSIEVDVSENVCQDYPCNPTAYADTEPAEYRRAYAFFEAVASPSVSAAPKLISVQIHDYDYATSFDSDWNLRLPKFPTLFGGSMPCLRNIALCRVGLSWHQPWMSPANLSNLTSLELRNNHSHPIWFEFASLLQSSHMLQRLSLCWSSRCGNMDWLFALEDSEDEDNDNNTGNGTGDSDAPIHLPHLTHLTLNDVHGSRILRLLPKFDMPRIKNLTLEPTLDSANARFLKELAEMPASPTADLGLEVGNEESQKLLNKLEHLSFTGGLDPWSFKLGALGLVFDELHNLKSLQLRLPIYWYMTPSFCKLLLPVRGRVRLPSLETLIIHSDSEKITIPIRHVVQQRKERGFPLKALYLQKTCQPFDEADLRWFTENSVTVSLFCLCWTRSPVPSACFDHPKSGETGRTSCSCCPPEYPPNFRALQLPTEW